MTIKMNENLQHIAVYEAGKPIELVVREFGINPHDVVKLASNENPNGSSPKAVEAVSALAKNMYLYPDDSYFELKDALCEKFHVDKKQIIIGAGSDQIIEFATKAALVKGDTVLMNAVTFAMYEIYSKQCGATIIRTPGLVHDVAQFKAAYDAHKPKIVFLCVPNNPLGDSFTKNEVYELLSYFSPQTLVIVDCAYMEYAAYKCPDIAIDADDLIARFPNALYLGTFSKAYGLGGMRVGYGIASHELCSVLYKVRPPFNVTNLSAAAALAALRDNEFVSHSIEQNFAQMTRYETFAKDKQIQTMESYTNFITYFFDDSKNSTTIADALLRRGVIIRNLASYSLNAIRITIGTKTQNDRFFSEFEKVAF